jgi:hypothetical protein
MTFKVEHREGFYFVVDREIRRELAPVFDYDVTANEVCEKTNLEYPFFCSIPRVPVDSPYPRPNIIMPRPFPHKVKKYEDDPDLRS